MSGLISSLLSASRALQAQQYGLDVTGQNIANLNTDGYVRRTATLAEVPGVDHGAGGVEVLGSTAQRAFFMEGRLLAETPAEQQQGAIADSLAVVQASLGDSGSSIDGSLTAFFDAFSTLADDPASAVGRDGVVLQGRLLASAFNDMAGRLADSVRAADAGIRIDVGQINALADQIASLNGSIGGANGADVETLKDQQAVALKTLAGLTSVTVLRGADGTADVTVGNGRALVVGANSYDLGLVSSGLSGLASITSGGVDITSELGSGHVGGLLQTRDVLVPGYQGRLDQLAYTVVQQVNTAHAAGYDASGNTGNNFFAPLGSTAGAAAAMALDPGVAADSTRVAASQTGAIGDNEVAKTIANLRDARVLGAGTATFTDSWSQLVYQVGNDAKTAQTIQANRQEVIASIQQLRDSISGVSLDEEAGLMLKFQRAYEANAKYFSAVNSTLDVLMGIVRG